MALVVHLVVVVVVAVVVDVVVVVDRRVIGVFFSVSTLSDFLLVSLMLFRLGLLSVSVRLGVVIGIFFPFGVV